MTMNDLLYKTVSDHTLVLGIDLGTTTLSAAVVDLTGHTQVNSHTVITNASRFSEKDFREQDPDLILQKTTVRIDSILSLYPNIRASGFTGQMHGILYTDKYGHAVSPLFTWQDRRADREITCGKTYCDDIKEHTGHNISTGYGLATHYYNTKNALVPTKSVYLCTLMDYVVMRLSNTAVPVIHSTNAASLGLYLLEENRFDFNSLSILGMTNIQLPSVTTTPVAAGYYKKIPVFTSIGDNQASFFGTVRHDRDILLNYGTGAQISVITTAPSPLPGTEIRPYFDGKYLLCGSALCGGRAYAILGNFFKEYLSACGFSDHDPYAVMNQLAAKAYPYSPLKISTTFSGTRSEPEKKGAILHLDENNFKPEFFALGVLQGMVDELYDLCMNAPSITYRDVIASGNAVQKNPILRQLISDKFKTPAKLPVVKEEAAFGAALTAALYSGLDNIENIKRCIAYQ